MISGNLFIITAASGAGKTSLVKALLDKITTQQDEDGEAPSSEQEAVKELG